MVDHASDLFPFYHRLNGTLLYDRKLIIHGFISFKMLRWKIWSVPIHIFQPGSSMNIEYGPVSGKIMLRFGFSDNK